MEKSYLLVSMGGPKKEEDLKVFLKNMFLDEHIIPYNIIIRKLLSFFISTFRPKKVLPHYKKIGLPSPIILQTYEQAKALEKFLKKKINVAFSYIDPYVKDVIKTLKKNIFLIPMYPHYSYSTFQAVVDDAKKHKLSFQNLYVIKPFYDKDFFINYYQRKIKELLKDIKGESLIIFSAHSIPLYLVEKFKDPYPQQVEKSVYLIMKNINIPYVLAYQSKLGPVKWLKPSVEEILKKYKGKYKNIIFVPISFLCEHLETLYEIDKEYKELAYSLGYKNIYRVPTPYIDKDFIESFTKYISEEKNYEKV